MCIFFPIRLRIFVVFLLLNKEQRALYCLFSQVKSRKEKSLHGFEVEGKFWDGRKEDAEKDYQDFENTAEITAKIS